MIVLPGISGSLFPGSYLVEGLLSCSAASDENDRLDRRRRDLSRWWEATSLACGPATGLRAVVDVVATPLFGALGFRISESTFERQRARLRLQSSGGAVIGALVLPWAAERRTVWRDVADTARSFGARWCFVLSPPFVSLVDTRGHAVRHSVDFVLPDTLSEPSFARFWMIASATAFDGPVQLDALVSAAARFQERVRVDLQAGVIQALAAFGRILGRNPDAPEEALTLVYRLLFLLFAESRELVPRDHPIYGRAYSVAAFCRTAVRHEIADGLWHGLAAITRLSRAGCRVDDLIVRPFNGRLFARASAPSLETGLRRGRPSRSTLARDEAMREALVALGTRPGPAGREFITYADLGVEQLGAVYERILDVDVAGPAAERQSRHSLRRKQTGTFYTPQPLAEFVVRRTLAPLVASASADAILALRVVDPAMGSGAFLVAACRYLAAAYERALVDEGRCAETDFGEHERAHIRRLIAEKCLAGVDANPVAVQLARLSLWLTTLARGRPLNFLDHRLRIGNSLIGAAPDDLFRLSKGSTRAQGDRGSLPLFETAGLEESLRLIAHPLMTLSSRADDSVDDVRAKEAIWSRLSGSDSPIAPWRQAADLWCARWFMDSPPSPSETRATFDAVLKRDPTLTRPVIARWLDAARQCAATHRFFHWPLEFADVFYDEDGRPKTRAGFDAVIGNPPWEMVRNDADKAADKAAAERFGPQAFVRFVRDSGLYPHCDRGHLNLYQPFVERSLSLTRSGGRVGLILPWGLAADDGATPLRNLLLERGGLDTVVGCDNAAGMFPIHRGLRFLVAVATPGCPNDTVRAKFGVRTTEDIEALPDREDDHHFPIRLSKRRLCMLGGIARRIPDVRDAADLALLEMLTHAHPALGDPDGWSARFGRELNATDDRALFGAHGLPVVEGKHLSPFAVDAGTTTERIDRRDAARRLPDKRFEQPRLGYRDVSGVGNRFALIAAVIPAGVVTTHTVFCLRTPISPERRHFLCGVFNSWVMNAVVRMLMGGHVTTSLVEGLPVPRWTGDALQRRIARLARALARRPASMDMGAELQASVARLYRLDVETFRHVLTRSPLVPEEEKRRALARFC